MLGTTLEHTRWTQIRPTSWKNVLRLPTRSQQRPHLQQKWEIQKFTPRMTNVKTNGSVGKVLSGLMVELSEWFLFRLNYFSCRYIDKGFNSTLKQYLGGFMSSKNSHWNHAPFWWRGHECSIQIYLNMSESRTSHANHLVLLLPSCYLV